jgi:hypothetical protein
MKERLSAENAQWKQQFLDNLTDDKAHEVLVRSPAMAVAILRRVKEVGRAQFQVP